MENTSKHNAVEEWNSELANVLIPNDVILIMYIVLGITGNTIVILVYGFRMTKKSEDRYFIPVLAVSDLAGATVCGSFGIALNMMQAEFYNAHLCKAWWFFAAFTTYMSILLLLIIATQRYLKVCRPLGKQMSLFHKRLAIGLALGLAAVLAGPTTALYGSVDFPKADGSVVGTRCSKLKNVSKTGTLIYGVIIVIICITSMTAMIYFYSRIGHKIYTHFKYSTAFNTERRPSCKEQLSSNSESHFETEKDTCTSEIITSDESVVEPNVSKSETKDNGEINTPPKELKRKTVPTTKKNEHEHQNRRIMHKFTIMFMLITTVFLICYIPKVILMVTEGLNPKFWQNFSDSERAGVLFIYRMYILNNVINPFIYAFMDLDFRKETKALFTCQYTKLKCFPCVA